MLRVFLLAQSSLSAISGPVTDSSCGYSLELARTRMTEFDSVTINTATDPKISSSIQLSSSQGLVAAEGSRSTFELLSNVQDELWETDDCRRLSLESISPWTLTSAIGLRLRRRIVVARHVRRLPFWRALCVCAVLRPSPPTASSGLFNSMCSTTRRHVLPGLHSPSTHKSDRSEQHGPAGRS
jgi:hypothetical protein